MIPPSRPDGRILSDRRSFRQFTKEVAEMATDDRSMVRAMMSAMEVESTVTTEGASEVFDAINEKLLATSSLEELLDETAGLLAKAADFVNHKLTIQDVRWNRSGFSESRMPVYAVVSGVDDDTSAPFTMGIGGETVMTQLWKMQREEWLPATVRLRSFQTSSGNDVFKLTTP